MSDETRDPQEAARDALLRGIAKSTEHALEKLNASAEADALLKLAEAYAYLVSPSQSH
jgi:hypothetical protein